MNAIVATFVFSVYLTSTVGDGPARRHHAGELAGSGAGAVAGLTVAVLAPVTGIWVERRTGGARRWPC